MYWIPFVISCSVCHCLLLHSRHLWCYFSITKAFVAPQLFSFKVDPSRKIKEHFFFFNEKKLLFLFFTFWSCWQMTYLAIITPSQLYPQFCFASNLILSRKQWYLVISSTWHLAKRQIHFIYFIQPISSSFAKINIRPNLLFLMERYFVDWGNDMLSKWSSTKKSSISFQQLGISPNTKNINYPNLIFILNDTLQCSCAFTYLS